jgi:hypothetical protein
VIKRKKTFPIGTLQRPIDLLIFVEIASAKRTFEQNNTNFKNQSLNMRPECRGQPGASFPESASFINMERIYTCVSYVVCDLLVAEAVEMKLCNVNH